MAKHQVSVRGTSRIRFIMLDAEIPEGDLNQLTVAIQNALKPTTIVQRVPPQLLPGGLQTGNDNDAAESSDDTEPEVTNGDALTVTKSAPKPRKPTVPKVLELDLASGKSFVSFAKEHNPEGEPDRNLIVAAWFKEHRNIDAITANHVYTCYRAAGWSVGIDDFSWPLRALKRKQLMGSGPSTGEYAINHLGLDRVQKIAVAAG